MRILIIDRRRRLGIAVVHSCRREPRPLGAKLGVTYSTGALGDLLAATRP